MHAPPATTVSKADLEREFGTLIECIADPRAGLFGPDSRLWSINRNTAMFLGSGRAALLQLAHPWVAKAIEDHSQTLTDPYARFQRTFGQIFAMVFGDLDSALAAARRVHALHGTIRGGLGEHAGRWPEGSPYQANEAAALMWVHATLWETSVTVFEAFIRPLAEEEKEAYYQETLLFGQLFGLSRATMPKDWPAFLAYNRRMWHSPELAVGDGARKLARFLLAPSDPIFAPLAGVFRVLTTGLLPAPLREAFELPFEEKEQRSFERWLRWLRRVLPRLPRRLRYLPPYLEAQRRLAGLHSRDRVGELLQRLYVGAPRHGNSKDVG